MEVTNSELGPRYEGELNTAGYTEVGGNVKKLSYYRRPTGGRESDNFCIIYLMVFLASFNFF